MSYYGKEEYYGGLKDHVLCVVALESFAVAIGMQYGGVSFN